MPNRQRKQPVYRGFALAARIRLIRDIGSWAFLLDDREAGAAVNNLFDLLVLVADGHEEMAGVRADGLVDLERHVEPLRACIVGAFTHEAGRLDGPVVASGELPNLLVHRAE